MGQGAGAVNGTFGSGNLNETITSPPNICLGIVCISPARITCVTLLLVDWVVVNIPLIPLTKNKNTSAALVLTIIRPVHGLETPFSEDIHAGLWHARRLQKHDISLLGQLGVKRRCNNSGGFGSGIGFTSHVGEVNRTLL